MATSAEQPSFDTEGDVREYVEENPDEAVRTRVVGEGLVWFHVDADGDFQVVLEPDEGDPKPGPILGDDFHFTPINTEREVRDADEVPDL